MTALVIAALAFGVSALVGLVAIEAREQRRQPQLLQTVRLRFGRDVTEDAVLGVLARFAGLRRGIVISLDVKAERGQISHYLTTDRSTIALLRGALGALLPALRLHDVPPQAAVNLTAGRQIRLRGRLQVLQAGQHEQAAAALLASLQPLGRGEQLHVRWVIRPGRARQLRQADRDGTAIPGDDRARLRQKNAGPVLEARAFLGAASGHSARRAQLLGRVSSVFRSRSTAYGRMVSLPLGRSALPQLLARRWFLTWDRYAADELAGLLGWPIAGPTLPGVALGTSPLLLPSERIPSTGRVYGEATWPGMTRKIAQPVVGSLSHSLVAGPTGSGKSVLITELLVQDMAAGRSVVLIDGKGDTVDAVLERVPASRRDDVIVLDCAADTALPGIQLFPGGGADPELAADVVLSVFADLFKDSWGVLSERYLRAGLVAVAHDMHGTLVDTAYVYSDAAYRRKLMSQLRDPLVLATLQAFEGMSAGERSQQLGSTLNKLSSLMGRAVVRTALGQSEPSLDFRAVLREQKIVLVSLAPARVGSAASRLIGAVVVFALFQAVQARTGSKSRIPATVVIDEPKALGALPVPLDVLLEQARGLGVGVTIAPQSIAQLPKNLREAILTNAATRIVFRQNEADARLLARDLPGVSPDDLQDLAAFEAVARIGLGPGDVAPPVTIRTAPPSRPTSDPVALRSASASRYGQLTADVDAAIAARHQFATSPSGPGGRPGRTPRGSA